jgi:hypothetical protein
LIGLPTGRPISPRELSVRPLEHGSEHARCRRKVFGREITPQPLGDIDVCVENPRA